MDFIPRFKLYENYGESGETLIYTFEVVQETNAPQSTIKSTVIEGIRGQGCIVISGSEGSWDLKIRGIFLAEDYKSITDKIDALEYAVTLGTKFTLVFDKTEATAYIYNVIRITPIDYPESLRTDYQEYIVTLKANAW